MSSPGFPHPSGHVVVIDPTPEGGGRTWCVPHGEIAECPTYLGAFLAAVVHDREHGGDTT